MRSIVAIALAALPAALAAKEIYGQRMDVLLPRQDPVYTLPVFCTRTTVPTSAPNFCEASCGTGYNLCQPATDKEGEITCFGQGQGQQCCPSGNICPADSYCTDVGCCLNDQSLSECGANASEAPVSGPVATAPPQSPSSAPGSPAGYGPSSSVVPPPPPPYGSVSSESTTSSPPAPPPYSPPATSETWSSTPSGPVGYPPESSSPSGPPVYPPAPSSPGVPPSYPPVVTDSSATPPDHPSGYPPVITDSWSSTPTGPSGYPPVITDSWSSPPTGPSGYPPVITDSWSSSPSIPPVYPTVPAPSNGTNGTVPWYPAPQQTDNAAVRGEVAGWTLGGLALLGLGFFM